MMAAMPDNDHPEATTATPTPNDEDPTRTDNKKFVMREKPQPRQLNRHERRKQVALQRKQLKKMKKHGKLKAKNPGGTSCQHGTIESFDTGEVPRVQPDSDSGLEGVGDPH